MNLGFESFVNSEECKTISLKDVSSWRLRALLIQKSVKLLYTLPDLSLRLRALLIQKSVKLEPLQRSGSAV